MDRTIRRRLLAERNRIQLAVDVLLPLLTRDDSDLDIIRERFVDCYNEAKEAMFTIDQLPASEMK